jgi:hypothetical protein
MRLMAMHVHEIRYSVWSYDFTFFMQKLVTDAAWVRRHIQKRVCTRYVKRKSHMPDFGPDIKYTE